MKTMKANNTIVRVSEKDQSDFLKRGYTYVSKSVWKNEVRDVNSKKTEKVVDEKTEVEAKKTIKKGKKEKKY